jgi:hypothetical protein
MVGGVPEGLVDAWMGYAEEIGAAHRRNCSIMAVRPPRDVVPAMPPSPAPPPRLEGGRMPRRHISLGDLVEETRYMMKEKGQAP